MSSSKAGAKFVPCMISSVFRTLTLGFLPSSFTEIYDTLPPEAQRKLLESYLVPLLDDLPDSLSIKVINTAKEMQMHFMGIPKLDYATKQTELEGLLNEIERDQKQSQYTKERSAREKLFEETIDSLSTWVNDIWSVTFEYQTNFRLAHRCLLLAADILRRAFSPFGGCVLFYLPLKYRWIGMSDVTVPLRTCDSLRASGVIRLGKSSRPFASSVFPTLSKFFFGHGVICLFRCSRVVQDRNTLSPTCCGISKPP